LQKLAGRKDLYLSANHFFRASSAPCETDHGLGALGEPHLPGLEKASLQLSRTIKDVRFINI
jgi:hypothetical protein